MNVLDEYYSKCLTTSDINQHLPTLRFFASMCKSVVECGVRNVVSTYAFAAGLPEDGFIHMVDIERSENVDNFVRNFPRSKFVHDSSLTCPLVNTDLLFIDTWHVYGQLKRELNRWHSHVNKYIILHDTEVDGIYGETIRNRWNSEQQSIETGIPEDEILRGLLPAIDEFLVEHKEWKMILRYYNNNGLTVLAKDSA